MNTKTNAKDSGSDLNPNQTLLRRAIIEETLVRDSSSLKVKTRLKAGWKDGM